MCRVCQVCKVRRLASPFGRSDHLIQAKQLNKERKAPTQLHGLQVGLHRSLPNSNTSQVRMLESLHTTRILQRNGSVNSLRWIMGSMGSCTSDKKLVVNKLCPRLHDRHRLYSQVLLNRDNSTPDSTGKD